MNNRFISDVKISPNEKYLFIETLFVYSHLLCGWCSDWETVTKEVKKTTDVNQINKLYDLYMKARGGTFNFFL